MYVYMLYIYIYIYIYTYLYIFVSLNKPNMQACCNLYSMISLHC